MESMRNIVDVVRGERDFTGHATTKLMRSHPDIFREPTLTLGVVGEVDSDSSGSEVIGCRGIHGA